MRTRAWNGPIVAAVAAVCFSANAYAYLDPGTGSIILQGLIAGVSALLVAGNLYWTRLKGWLGIGRKRNESSLIDASSAAEPAQPNARAVGKPPEH